MLNCQPSLFRQHLLQAKPGWTLRLRVLHFWTVEHLRSQTATALSTLSTCPRKQIGLNCPGCVLLSFASYLREISSLDCDWGWILMNLPLLRGKETTVMKKAQSLICQNWLRKPKRDSLPRPRATSCPYLRFSLDTSAWMPTLWGEWPVLTPTYYQAFP